MKAFIKDCTDINGRTKAFINIVSGTIKEDRLTTANSSFISNDIPRNVNIGDVLVLLDNKAKTLYYGKITSIEDTKIQTSQILSLFSGTFIYSIVDELKTLSPSTYLEEEIKKVLDNFKGGNLYESDYVDTLIETQLDPINITYEGSLEVGLPTDKDKDNNEQFTQKDVVKWMYELYETYGIVFDFTIPQQEGQVECKIWKPNFQAPLKITDGFECINSIKPNTTQQSTNKLVIYSKDKVYRDTYVLTINGIEKEPSAIVGRPNQINTKIVFSDDDINDIVSANLSETLLNHKIEFNVDLHSKLFTFDDLKLDIPIQVYNGTDFYDTKITGREYEFNSNGITKFKVVCGNVRNSLTQKIGMGIV